MFSGMGSGFLIGIVRMRQEENRDVKIDADLI